MTMQYGVVISHHQLPQGHHSKQTLLYKLMIFYPSEMDCIETAWLLRWAFFIKYSAIGTLTTLIEPFYLYEIDFGRE